MEKSKFQFHYFEIALTLVILLVPGQFIKAQANWIKRGSEPDKYILDIDSVLKYDKQTVMALRSIVPVSKGYGVARQNINPKSYIGKRIRMTANMKTKDVSESAVFFLRFDKEGKDLLIDNMNNRPVQGNTEWTNYSLVIDVPTNADDMIFGTVLQGKGQIWFTNPVFDIVDNSVANTTSQLLMTYPIIKSVPWTGVFPVQGIDEIPDPNLSYKLLMELTSGIKNNQDSTAIGSINTGLALIGRVMNLHAASGIPKKNIDVVAVVHGQAINSLLNNESFKKKYKTANPNLQLLKELQDAGIKLIACGQTMAKQNIKKEDLIAGVKMSLTAQTVISSYQIKHYVQKSRFPFLSSCFSLWVS